MKEFDLIPDSYRNYVWMIQTMKIFFWSFICLLIFIIVAYSALVNAKQNANEKIDEYNQIKQLSQNQQAKLSELQAIKNNLNSEWKLLNGLRSTPPPENIIYAIDKALENLDIWFTQLNYQRTEQITENNKTVETGYFIIVQSDQNDQTLSLGAKLTIIGGATDHSTLSTFVKNLMTESTIIDARVMETTMQGQQDINHINYVVELIINQHKQRS